MTQLKGSVIVLTGANGGFGQQFTRQLLQAGSHLILTDLDETTLREQVNQTEKEITTGKVLACWGMDLSHREGCQNLYDLVNDLKIPVDILINNAGIGLYGRMDQVPSDKWEELMQLNLLTPMRLSSLFMTDMIARQKGHIVNISSLAGWIAAEGMTHYCTSKFGLRGFSEGLFQEVKRYNVKVTGVYPFFSRTPILQSKQYGSLAQERKIFPSYLITDPAKVIKRTIRAIEGERLHVFPDQTAKYLSFLQTYFPILINLLNHR